MKDNKKKHIILVSLVAIILTITISITYAKYSEFLITSIGGSIAKWDVSIEADDDKDISLVAGKDTKEYTIKVKSYSNVKANYSIVVSDLPDNVEVKLDDGDYQQGNEITFDNAGSIDADADSESYNEHKLTLRALIGASKVSNLNIDIDVVFVQEEV